MIKTSRLNEKDELVDVILTPKQYALNRLQTTMITYADYWAESFADEVEVMTAKEVKVVNKAINDLARRIHKMIEKAGG